MTNCLIMFSGGVDSTYLAWRFMVEKKSPLHLHHISIRNNSAFSWEIQDEAARKIVSYFKNQGFEFKYSESIFEFLCLPRCGLDVDVQLLFAQKVARNMSGNVDVCTGGFWDNRMDLEAKAKRIERVRNIWRALLADSKPHDHINKTLRFPLLERGIDKKQMIEEMPEELFKLTWSCRGPVNGKPCQSCHPCRDIAEATK